MGHQRQFFLRDRAGAPLFRQDSYRRLSPPGDRAALGGQLLLLVSIFLNRPRRWVLLAGTALCGCLVLLVLLGGSLAGNARMILSTLPFLILRIIAVRRHASPAF